MLDWLIVGGGIHGTYHSFYLTRVKGVARERLRVLDPYDAPLGRWHELSSNTGMAYLRSPHAHNLDHDPWSIATFARTRAGEPLARYIPIHNRPSLELFNTHSQWLIARHRLDELRLVGRAAGLTKLPNRWRVETASGSLEARHVLLAISATEQPHVPAWAVPLRQQGAPIHHIFDLGFHRETLPDWSYLVVVGGGITAAQTALVLAERAPGTVTLLMRHEIRVHHFDSDLCWIGADCLKSFHAEPDINQRRKMIRQARHHGSLPPDVHAELQAVAQQGLLRVCTSEIATASGNARTIQLSLANGQSTIHADRVILATGFEAARPGGTWLDNAIAEYDLPVAGCGYPVVDATLAWHPGLRVSGPLAELEIGPVSRNFIGARLAAERIARAVN